MIIPGKKGDASSLQQYHQLVHAKSGISVSSIFVVGMGGEWGPGARTGKGRESKEEGLHKLRESRMR